MDEIQLAS